MTATTTKRRVLVVDDDKFLCTLEQKALTTAGFEAETADNGALAKELILQRDFDLVVIDLMMPVLGGLGLIRWLRDEARSGVPILVFTSHTSEDIVEEALSAGATRVLGKPLDLPKFLAAVDAVVDPP